MPATVPNIGQWIKVVEVTEDLLFRYSKTVSSDEGAKARRCEDCD
jgi:hypothetical protein